MSQSKKASSRPELLFLDFDIDDLKGPNLPTNGDMLRYYFYCRHALPEETSQSISRTTVSKCMKIWSDNEIPTTRESNAIKIFEKLLLEFNRMKSLYKNASEAQRQKQINMWRQKYELLFLIAARDAHENCSVENREKLLDAKKKIKEFDTAVKNNTFEGVPKMTVRSELKSPKEVKDDSLNNNLANYEEMKNSEPPKTKVKPKLKAFKQLDNNDVMNSPNQNLREQLKKEGWVYIKNKPTWKLAVVVPPSKSSV